MDYFVTPKGRKEVELKQFSRTNEELKFTNIIHLLKFLYHAPIVWNKGLVFSFCSKYVITKWMRSPRSLYQRFYRLMKIKYKHHLQLRIILKIGCQTKQGNSACVSWMDETMGFCWYTALWWMPRFPLYFLPIYFKRLLTLQKTSKVLQPCCQNLR